MIDSGVEAEKIPAARAEIERQLGLLKAGAFTDDDMENTRRYLISQYRTMGDSQPALAAWYLGAATETPQSPEEAATEIAAVTRERILAAVAAWEIACEFRLLPSGEAEEGGEEDA